MNGETRRGLARDATPRIAGSSPDRRDRQRTQPNLSSVLCAPTSPEAERRDTESEEQGHRRFRHPEDQVEPVGHGIRPGLLHPHRVGARTEWRRESQRARAVGHVVEDVRSNECRRRMHPAEQGSRAGRVRDDRPALNRKEGQIVGRVE